MIGVSGDEYKFPPFVIFKGKNTRSGVVIKKVQAIERRQQITTEGEHDGYPLSMRYAVQERAWMDTATMNKWIDAVYIPWATRINGPNMVLLDLGPAHAKTEIVDRIAEYQGHVEFIPAHTTSVLQVMDVGINKPFKNRIKDEYDEWFHNNHDNDVRARPQRQDVARWIETAWSVIRPTTITNTWRHIGWNFNEMAANAAAANEVAVDDFDVDDHDVLRYSPPLAGEGEMYDDEDSDDETDIEDDNIEADNSEAAFY
jgi:DDE superfamily endonuclease